MIIDNLLQKNVVPDSVLRLGIKTLLKARLRRESHGSADKLDQHKSKLVEELKASPIALNTLEANEQHYEVPARFYEIVLGGWLKYSSGFWYKENKNLTQSEEDMLIISLDRADIGTNQKVLDLGCGWGSFSLYAAELYPESAFTAVSNSSSQKAFIDNKARERGIENLTVITADINEFNPEEKFDRIVSVEMFEHVRNYEQLFGRIQNWLLPDGKLFVHIFTHKDYAYKFEAEREGDWMARHFFTGGMMPSDDLLFHFSGDFKTLNHWNINGKHYSQTLEAWLVRMDNHKNEIMEIFKETYGDEAKKFWAYWRIFFMACAETFAYRDGTEWGVSHYLFQKN
jgi:cyclopropane-fatty-acyl-phospholipid synthase